MKRFLKKLSTILTWIALLLVIGYLTYGEGWKDLTLGRFLRKSDTIFSDVSDVTKVKIYLLMGSDEQRSTETFPIPSNGTNDPVYGEVMLTGEQLEEFLKHWRWQTPVNGGGAMCHHPPYGFRLYKGSILVTETSVCWECSNYTVSVWPFVSTYQGFDSSGEQAQDLLNFCDNLLAYNRTASKSNPTVEVPQDGTEDQPPKL